MSGSQAVLLGIGSGGPAADPLFSDVLVLINHEDPGSTWIDRSSFARSLSSAGTVAHSSTTPKWGAQCATFNNGNVFLQSSADFNFGNNTAFTFDGWIRPEAATTGDFWSRRAVANATDFWSMRFNNDGTLRFFLKVGNVTTVDFQAVIGNAISLNNYHYVGLTRDDPTPGTFNRWRLWADGAVIATQTVVSTFPTATNNPRLGAGDDSGAGGFLGRIDDWRVTRNNARDLSVVPTAGFPTF